MPVYELIGKTLRVHFKALPEALIDSNAPKSQSDKENVALDDALVLKIIEILKEDINISQDALAEKLNVTRRTIQRKMNDLKKTGKIVRKGGKRFGYWEILKPQKSENKE